MANTDIVSRFFEQIARRPPLIETNRPAPLKVVRMLPLLTAMSEHLSGLSLFQMRSAVVESKWPRILLWLAALLKPLDDFIDPSFPANRTYSDTVNHCVVKVFTFLNALNPSSTCTDDELENFVMNLASSPELFLALAKAWVAFFTRRWPVVAHCEVTSFLMTFGRGCLNTNLEHSFRVAVRNSCPDSQLLPTWSTAIAELCSQPSSLIVNSAIQKVNRGLLIAVTTTFFEPIPTLDKIQVPLAQTHKLWGQLMVDSCTPDLCHLTIYSLARFSLRVISGGPKWIVKALDADLLGLLTKTLAWLQTLFSSSPDGSVHDVFQEILHLLLLNSIYKAVQRGILRNIKRLPTQQSEHFLGLGNLKRMWDALVGEVCSPATCSINTICFQEALKDICSNDNCPHDSLPGHRAKLCGNCLVTNYCSIRCQREHWQAEHKTECPGFKVKQFRPTLLNGLNRAQLFLRALIQAQQYRNEIHHSIASQGLQSSQIVIEISFMSYPPTWKVSDQASSPDLQSYLTDHYGVQEDTVVSVECSCASGTVVYFARGVRCAALLDPAYDLVDKNEDGKVFGNIKDILL
ncbi:hypothetical protein C8R42DRAFT_644032 [Lentinula raphanica]|nr:hypothetical protein C8R42DRAFT_644032 [Lentinula raphanica]